MTGLAIERFNFDTFAEYNSISTSIGGVYSIYFSIEENPAFFGSPDRPFRQSRWDPPGEMSIALITAAVNRCPLVPRFTRRSPRRLSISATHLCTVGGGRAREA